MGAMGGTFFSVLLAGVAGFAGVGVVGFSAAPELGTRFELAVPSVISMPLILSPFVEGLDFLVAGVDRRRAFFPLDRFAEVSEPGAMSVIPAIPDIPGVPVILARELSLIGISI